MAIYRFEDKSPVLGERAFVAEEAVVIGDVHLGADVSLWPGVIVRGDMYPIRIGDRTNVQDGTVIHVTENVAATTIGSDVVVGHLSLLHGCTVGNRCLIGMGSVLLDGVVVEDECVIGAGAMLLPGTRIPKRSLVLGRPGKVVRSLSDDDLVRLVDGGVSTYVDYKERMRTGALTRIDVPSDDLKGR
jgi:carbonic anhydrase/acetyltransferase-like protein (isoleucine patch superfamily)